MTRQYDVRRSSKSPQKKGSDDWILQRSAVRELPAKTLTPQTETAAGDRSGITLDLMEIPVSNYSAKPSPLQALGKVPTRGSQETESQRRQGKLPQHAVGKENVVNSPKLHGNAQLQPLGTLGMPVAQQEGGLSELKTPVQRQEEGKKTENNTGLPDRLKEGIENLSGYSMDAVRVHYNSDKPAKINALAYTQGIDIHVGPAQERHLPHESWHVVQQMQGRVKPTIQTQGVSLNDDAVLESEADVMGAKAANLTSLFQQSRTELVTSPLASNQNSYLSTPNEKAIQRQYRTTSVYTKDSQKNKSLFKKQMEIIDSTDINDYVHLSRSAENDKETVKIEQQNRDFFNGQIEPTRRTRIQEHGQNIVPDMRNYTPANNAHITLEGRYKQVMVDLGNGFDNRESTKKGPPVAEGGWANLNFGSYVAHGNVSMSDFDITQWIENTAKEAIRSISVRQEDWENQNQELKDAVNDVENSTMALTERLIDNSPLKNLPDEDFVHYNGEPWKKVKNPHMG
ncbi:DUF4157 domain-containing protein [Moorena producens]|uniref:eCIS core domain-containing protein n=1 Tax=Moorena producens TaxID=1155739 RepID=UPI003C73772D